MPAVGLRSLWGLHGRLTLSPPWSTDAVSSARPDEKDLRPDWIKAVIFDVHFLHFGCILFLIVLVSVVVISLLTEPIPEECVSTASGPSHLRTDMCGNMTPYSCNTYGKSCAPIYLISLQ